MSIIGAIVAGLVGTIAMSLALAGAPQMGMQKMDLVGMLGATFNPQANRILGWAMHLLLGILFSFAYAALWAAGIGTPDVTVGLVFGIVHWLIAGLLMGLLANFNAGMRAGTVKAPGRYMLQLGGSMGFFGGLMAHIIYGLTVGLVYGIFRM